jgi:hypothetical protein
MNERFEDVEEAHTSTFDWVFDSDAVGVQLRSSRSSLASFATTSSSNSQGYDRVNKETAALQEAEDRHDEPLLRSDEDEPWRARSGSLSQESRGSTRSLGVHTATLDMEESGSTEQNVILDNIGESHDYDSGDNPSIISWSEVENGLSADHVHFIGGSNIPSKGTGPSE